MPKLGGIKEAAKMLAGLDSKARENVLEAIAKQNPEMAAVLKSNLIDLDDLKYLTVKMLQELLTEITTLDLGMALRISSSELKDFIFSNVSSSIKEEIQEVLTGPPQSVNKIQEATARILEIVRVKVDKGELIISKSGSEEYV